MGAVSTVVGVANEYIRGVRSLMGGVMFETIKVLFGLSVLAAFLYIFASFLADTLGTKGAKPANCYGSGYTKYCE